MASSRLGHSAANAAGEVSGGSVGGAQYSRRPKDDFLGIASRLEMNKNLGVADSMLVGTNEGLKRNAQQERGLTGWQHNQGLNLRTDAASWVVPKALRDLADLLPGGDDVGKTPVRAVQFAYQVEPVGQVSNRAHKRALTKPYSAPARDKGTMIQFGGMSTRECNNDSASAVAKIARHYASSVNAYSSTGIASNMSIAQEIHRGSDMLGIFSIMWMIQLDIAGGNPVDINIDAGDVRRLVPVGLNPLEEAEAMKSQAGLRIHRAALEPLALVMLYTATHRAALTQASPWLDRYTWPDTDMTVYNGPLPAGTVGRQLHGRSDAAQVAAVIVGIANTYDLRDACAAGYRVAQWLYGDRCVNSSVRLDCGPQTLFHEIENSVNRNTMPQMCWALSSSQLALASQFIGYANAEYMRDLPRSTVVHALRVRDAHAMRRALSNIDVHALETIVDRYIAGQTLLSDFPVDFAHHVRLGLRRSWVEKGVIHNLALGRAVGASISGSCVERLEMPDQAMLAETDVLAYGSAHARAEATAWLVNELIRNGGEHLCASLDEAVPKSGATTQMHVDCSYYMGMTLQFMVVGFGNDMVLKYHRPVNFVFTPTADQVRSDRDDQVRVPEVQPMIDIDNELARESERTRVETADDIMREVMAIRGSKQSTLFQRGPSAPMIAKPQFDEGTVIVTSPSDNVRAAVQELAEQGMGPAPTSGEGALCGANALHMALQVVQDTHELTVEAVNEMLRDAVRQTVTTEDLGEQATSWYSETQMAAVSRELGYNLTVVEGKGKGTAVAYSTTDIPDAKHLVVFQLTPGHWEGPGTTNAHTRVKVTGRPSGTPRVEHARTVGRNAFRRVLRQGENN
ncbi:putative coat protein [Fusarium oxysporum f. sp. dianthi mycovirus 1]|uniref:Putative coat protein n=1 Tax=Fusarium oxysporum f. sp. dianthi mycovirus 1 TaxID=1679238 RepID=A0A0H4PB19_9VIRU|nr:putative coat protein [Fusarium oxysporum f. sp. dianthi mycovirus 1]AKP45147.1 putative coat protein [Fusarium oxysporum f. sp. dianthi mycovirus 1]